MAFTLLTQNQAQITAQNDANIYRMLSMGEDLTFVEDIKLEFSASQVGIKEGYYLVCGRLVKAENTIISIPSTKGVYRLCLRVQPSASAIADRVKLILLDSTQSRSTTDINGDTASGTYDALLADFDTVTMRFTQRIQYAGVPLIDRVPTATKNSKGTVIAGQNLSINNQGVLNVVIPKAKASTLGGVKVGSGLSVEDDGTLSANVQEIPKATSSALGGVKIGNGLSVTSDGVLSADVQEIPVASDTTLGGVKVGTGGGLAISEDGTVTIDPQFAESVSDSVVQQRYINRFYKASDCVAISSDEKGFTGIDCVEVQPKESFSAVHTYYIEQGKTYAFAVPYSSDINTAEDVCYVAEGDWNDTINEINLSSVYTSSPNSAQQSQGYTACNYVILDTTNVQRDVITVTRGGEVALFEKDAGATSFTMFGSHAEEVYGLNSYEGNILSGMKTKKYLIRDNIARAFINKFTTDSNGNLYFNGKKVVLEN